MAGDWRLLRCGGGRGWTRSAGETWKYMKRYTWCKKKKLGGFYPEKEEQLDQSHTQRRKPAEGGDRGSDVGKRPSGRKRLGMLNEFLKAAPYAELNGKAKNRKEWGTWKPRTCPTTG